MVKSHVHYMDHKHFTNIKHGHSINDPGHAHVQQVGHGGDPYYALGGDGGFFWGNYDLDTSTNKTGITVNGTGDDWRLSTESRYINNTNINRQNTESNDTNAIENRPTNYTVKIWKRTA